MKQINRSLIRRIIGALRARSQSFARAEDGSFAILFAFCAIILIGFVGAAIDYTSITAAKFSLASSADAAALAAVSRGSMLQGATVADQIANSTAIGTNRFNAGQVTNGATLTSTNVVVTGGPGNYTAAVSYIANYNLVFGAFIGLPHVTLTGQATAVSGQNANVAPKYTDIYILADASGSMGIGATQGDIDAMNAGIGCSLGCHADGTDSAARKLTNLTTSAPVQLRFDVLKAAILNITNQAKAINSAGTPYVRIGVYSFATNFSTVIDITSDIDSVLAAVNAMTLQGFDAGTNSETALSTLQSKISVKGDGSSASNASAFAILATDAISNTTDNQAPGGTLGWTASPTLPLFSPHEIPDPKNNVVMDLEGVDPNWCAPLKSAGVHMMTLETQYLIAPTDLASNLRYNYVSQTLLPLASANMQACASDPTMAESAMTPSQISDGMALLFAKATQISERLTQ